jgi:hypothetical protein
MKTLQSAAVSSYATGYVDGRHAAKEHMPAYANPYQRSTRAYQGWSDGHYDERSARSVQVDRHSTSVWSHQN